MIYREKVRVDKMAPLVVWLLILVFGGIGGIVICSVFKGNKVFSGYAAIFRNDHSFIKRYFLPIEFDAPR